MAEAPGNTILHGDALDVLATLPGESVQAVVTSPPYWNLRARPISTIPPYYRRYGGMIIGKGAVKMVTSTCKHCGREIIRAGGKMAVFCSLTCKGTWQREQKGVRDGVTREWLYQKYVTEGLSSYQIAKVVHRDPKRVYEWLRDYGIPLRERQWDTTPDPSCPYQNENWLRQQYLDEKRSAAEIAAQFGVRPTTILYFLAQFQIPVRSTSEARAVKRWALSGPVNGMYGKSAAKNPNWKGGVSPERQAFYSSTEWADAVRVVWRRDGGRCQRCGAKYAGSVPFHIHHLVGFAVRELRTEPSNLALLCAPCHYWVHSRANTGKEWIRE